jgi:Uncharacterized protein conserved in bacteria (DUF2147)
MRGRAQGCAGTRLGHPERPEEGRRRIYRRQNPRDNGKIDSSKIQLTDGGKKLNVRGVSLLGRSQIWERQE